ncbi:MAG TPA: branched-chain amino acid ABC transporter permease [Candidatus Dormibacteraeota bacterium]|jgi:branched-chain amino acid transport system permease protein|nr:branched-chain amino acid ABC transporter permease [Candidatus Dormibacteraeota bacterium]
MSMVTEVRSATVEATPAEGAATSAMLPLPGRPGARVLAVRLVGLGILVPLLLTLPYALKWAGPAYALDFGLVVAMATLSISVLAWIGEITLATLAQMGLGVVGLYFLEQHGVPFALVLPIMAVASIPVSLVIGVFALRLRGVYFAIATLAFAYLAQKTVFQTYLGGQGGFDQVIPRPSYASDDYRLYYLLMGSLLAIAVVCALVRRSWIGTRIAALRDSEMAFAVLGHSPARYKLFTVCLAGAIATIAGIFYGILQQVVPANYFSPILAVLYFAYAVVGGFGSIVGAIAAGIVFGTLPKYFDSLSEGRFVGYDQFFAGFLALLIVLTAQGGLHEVGRRLWRRIEGRRV